MHSSKSTVQKQTNRYKYKCWSSTEAEKLDQIRFDARSGGSLQTEGQSLTVKLFYGLFKFFYENSLIKKSYTVYSIQVKSLLNGPGF